MEEDDWSIGFAADKTIADVSKKGIYDLNSSSGFFNWSPEDKEEPIKTEFKVEEEEVNSFAQPEPKSPLSDHQSTFEMVIKEELVKQEVWPRKIKEEVYSEEMSPIFLPSNFQTNHRRGVVDRKRIRSSGDYYSCKFRPMACSTPNWQAPMLSIMETQLSQTALHQQQMKTEQLEESQDLMICTNVTDLRDKGKTGSQRGMLTVRKDLTLIGSVDLQDRAESQRGALTLRKDLTIVDPEETLPPSGTVISAFRELIKETMSLTQQRSLEAIVEVGDANLELGNVFTNDQNTTLAETDANQVIDIINSKLNKETISSATEECHQTKIKLEDGGGDQVLCNQNTIYNKSLCNNPTEEIIAPNVSQVECEGEGDFCNFLNLIPEVMVTSYLNSSKDNLLGDNSPFVPSQVHVNMEEKRRMFIKRIEGIILEIVSSLNQKSIIDADILAYENGTEDMEMR